MSDPPVRTRLAPSPTGALHLGNARTFLVNWTLARQHGWQVVLRIDDLDGPRVKPAASRQAAEDLQWLGLDWDAGPIFQSADLEPYESALRRLAEGGWIYRCTCTRSQIEAASAPQEGAHELRYPGTCRPPERAAANFPGLTAGEECWRVRAPRDPITFVDQVRGAQRVDVAAQVGDFQVATKAGVPAYQLAAVVDDHRQGITAIVRGDDLLDSTARQQHLRQLLGLTSAPRLWHLPLVVGPDGRRLAKRHGDSRLRHYRQAGVSPQRVLGLLRGWCGGVRAPCTVQQFVAEFSLEKLPRDRITMTAADDDWLRGAG